MTIARSLAIAAVAIAPLLAAAAPAMAQEVRIKDAVARVVVIPEERSDIGVEIERGSADLPALQMRRVGSNVEIRGGLRSRGFFGGGDGHFRNCRAGPADARQPGEGASVEVRNIGRVNLEDAPLIVLRTPRDVEVSIGGAVWGSVGRGASSVDVGNAGCGGWTIANVDGPVSLGVAGSGPSRIGTSRSLDVSVAGSGDVAAAPTGDLEVSIAGSGDVTVVQASGDIEVSIAGSGDVHVLGGASGDLDVSIVGSGNVDHGGEVRDISGSFAGSGDVRVARATGSVERSAVGSGTIRVGEN
ncbi:GIN domain-containing protein [Brevundimonas lutea]|uniref:GIN domain-containing protein n=1 Tax=Brevundimonas lutea TaxID=2293980 RepID=UPI000F0410F1|nr:DUF2807 domain-containing protein [Brevundimonas lutea]